MYLYSPLVLLDFRLTTYTLLNYSATMKTSLSISELPNTSCLFLASARLTTYKFHPSFRKYIGIEPIIYFGIDLPIVLLMSLWATLTYYCLIVYFTTHHEKQPYFSFTYNWLILATVLFISFNSQLWCLLRLRQP